MAHARTTPLQLVFQVAIGGGLAAVLYKSLYKSSAALAPPSLEEALEAETRNTTGIAWGIKQEPQVPARASPSQDAQHA
jgi:hypothetical protein